MKAVAVVLALASLSLAPALGEESGRKAKVHLRDGSILDGVVLGCANGLLELATQGRKRSLELDSVASVAFGEAVGDHVRAEPKMLDIDDGRGSGSGPPGGGDPPSREPTEDLGDGPPLPEGPRTGPPGMDEESRRRLHEFVRWVWRLNMFRQLDASTNHFRDAALITKATSNLEAKLRETPDKGEANKDIRLALMTLAVADQRRLRAHTLLASLKKDYPGDDALQKLTVGALEFAVARARLGPARAKGPDARVEPVRPRGPPPRSD